MKAVAIKMKRYASNVNIVNNSDLSARALRFILVSLGVLALVYLVILANMVFNIVGRRTLEAQARSLSSDVNDMELSYLTMSNKVDLTMATSMGFKEVKPTFATRKSLGSLKPTSDEL